MSVEQLGQVEVPDLKKIKSKAGILKHLYNVAYMYDTGSKSEAPALIKAMVNAAEDKDDAKPKQAMSYLEPIFCGSNQTQERLEFAFIGYRG